MSELRLELARRVDQACNRFEAAWREGRPRIEDHLEGWAGTEREELLRELVMLDVEYRRAAGEACSAANYAALAGPDAVWLTEGLGQASSFTGRSTPGPVGRAARPTLLPGVLVGEHELLEEIGRGGMGVVYRARHRKLGRLVALKMVRAGQVASPEELRRFRAEAELAATLDHPNIIPLYEVGEHDGQPFFSMKLIEGGSLIQQLKRYQSDPTAAAELIATVAQGVHHAHQRGVLHRDLKPGNILIDAAGVPHVADFGLARQLECQAWMTQSGALVGTPSYMAPEQAAGKTSRLTTAADVYALGAVLYELLAGRPPFVGETALDTLVLVQTDEPVPPSRLRPGVPPDLEVICLKCLSKEPAGRYGSAEALAEDLDRWQAGEPISARPLTALARACRWARRHPSAAGLLAVSVVASLSLFAVAIGLVYSARLEKSNRELQLAREGLEEANAQLEKTLKQLEGEKQESDRQRQRANRLLYVSQMNLAGQAFKEGKIAHALRLLEALHPKGGPDEDLRGPEWHILWDQCGGYQRVFPAHADRVRYLALSSGGDWLASVGADGRVRVWEADKGRCVMDQGSPGEVLGVRVATDGRCVGVLMAGGRTTGWWREGEAWRVWPALLPAEAAALSEELRTQSRWTDTYAALGPVALAGALVGGPAVGLLSAMAELEAQPFRYEAVTPDGRFALTRTEFRDKERFRRVRFAIHDLHSRRLVTVFNPSGEYPREAALTPDGKRLGLVTTETLNLHELDQTRPAQKFHALSMIHAWALSRHGLLAVGGADGRVRLWNLSAGAGTGRARMKLKGGGTGLAFSPDGRYLAAFGDRTLSLRDATTGKVSFERSAEKESYSRGGFHPSMNSCYSHRTIWDVRQGGVLAKVNAEFRRMTYGGLGSAYSPDHRWLALADVDAINLFDPLSGKQVRSIPRPARMLAAWVTCVDFSPDGRWLAAGSGSVDNGRPGTITVWETATWKPVFHLDSHRLSVWRVKFSPDGRYLAAATGDYQTRAKLVNEVKVWDFASRQEVMTLGGHVECVFDLSFSPDGRRLASAGGKYSDDNKKTGELKIWDLMYGQELLTIKDHPGCVTGVAYSPDGKSLASISRDGTLIIRGELGRMWSRTGH